MRITWFILTACVLVAAGGCASGPSRERYDMIRAQADDKEDVQRLLGEPQFNLDDRWYYEDADDRRGALVYFDGRGRVIGKEWFDARQGTWAGRNPFADELPGKHASESTSVETIEP
jgi:hypothetical protein